MRTEREVKYPGTFVQPGSLFFVLLGFLLLVIGHGRYCCRDTTMLQFLNSMKKCQACFCVVLFEDSL